MQIRNIGLLMIFLLALMGCKEESIVPEVMNKQAICEFVYPVSGEVYAEGFQQAKVRCIAFDVDSNFERLDFLIDGEYIKSIDSFPTDFGRYNTLSKSVSLSFEYEGNTLLPGQHALALRIVDSIGYYQDSCIINILEKGTEENVKDYDGNEYATLRIGDQIWLASNLLTTHLNDGTPVKNIQENEEWRKNKKPAYSWYTWIENPKDFGAQYNYATVATEKICPQGWRVPSRLDWLELVKFIDTEKGPFNVDLKDYRWPEIARYLKTKSDWPDEPTNDYGFSFLPNPHRDYNANYQSPNDAVLWSSTVAPQSEQVYSYWIRNSNHYLTRYIYSPYSGFSIRCMKDSIRND